MARRRREPREPKAPVTYELSTDIQTAIAQVVGAHEVQFGWVNNFPIAGVMIRGSKAKDGGGCQAIARFVKVTPLWQQLTGYSIAVVVHGWAWDRLAADGKLALVAHELCHGSMSEKGALRLEKHDLSEFHFVARTYGPWDDSIALFDQQLELFDAKPAGNGVHKVKPNGKPVVDDDTDVRPVEPVNVDQLRGEVDRAVPPPDGPVH